jgi:hypothetical protein
LGLIGVVVVLYLRYVEIFRIGAVCTWCVAYGVTVVVAWLACALALRRAPPVAPVRGPRLSTRGRWHAFVASVRPRRSRTARPARVEVEIGDDTGGTMRWCPSCDRPLPKRGSRCPGCGAWLVFGVLARRALTFLTIGVAFGLVFGVVLERNALRGQVAGGGPSLASAAIGGRTPAPLATAPAAPSVEPTASPTAPLTQTPTPPPSFVPNTVAGSLEQAMAVNTRLSRYAASLRSLLASKSFNASSAVAIVRKIAADTTIGLQASPRLAGYERTAALGADLSAFYGDVNGTAGDALGLALSDNGGYRRAAVALLATLGHLPDITARTNAAALSLGLAAATPAP